MSSVVISGDTSGSVTLQAPAIAGTTVLTLPTTNGTIVTTGTTSGISGSAITTGTVGVSVGGTGQTTYTNGQLLIGNTTGNTLTKATLTQGTGITITNGAGSITIAASGSITPTTGTYGFNSNPSAASNKTNTTMAKYWECIAPYAGTYSTFFQMTGPGGGWTSTGQIYVNGVARGTSRSIGASTATYTEDVTVSAGDLIQVYGATASGAFGYSISRFACGTADGKTAGIPYYTGAQF